MRIFRYGEDEISHLRKRDRKLGQAIDEIGMIERNVTPDLFVALVASVASQQISAKAAEAVWRRMEERFNTISPERIAPAPVEEIQQCGMSLRKAGHIRGTSEAVAQGSLDLDDLHELPDNEVISGSRP
jgi:DNA-3-methyladenine glycosylase II